MIGQTVSHYKILEKLGEGGMGVVYKAEDTKLDRIVALKFLPSEFMRDPDAKERFMHEAKAASALNQTNICSIHTIEEVEGQQLLDMEFVEGKTLGVLLKEKELSLNDVLDIVVQIGEGLDAAHKKGIVHRDIKPDNIMLTDEALVKIMDFGLAKLKGASKITKTHSTVGTLAYMSPEQAQGEDVDQRTDIFSLGAVLYEMVTGRRPFRGEHEAAIMYSLMNETPQPLARYKTNVPDQLQRVVDKALSKNRDERYQHIGDMLVDLRALRSVTQSRLGSQKAKTKGGRNKALIAGTAIGVVVLIALVIAILPRFFRSGVSPKERGAADHRKMLVVLPFENLGSPDDDYFANGTTDAITARLTSVTGLGVISRQSAMQYKKTTKSIRQIGSELGVDYILEGTVQRERPGDPRSRVRVIPQLIRVADDTHVWAQTYDEDMTEVFRVQSDIAERVATQLDVTLLEPERQAIEKKPTENLAAYENYLHGIDFVDVLSLPDVETAVDLLKSAVSLDPRFAEAWVGLTRAYHNLYWVFDRPGMLSLEMDAAKHAQELAPDLPETHLALGYVAYAQREFDQALGHFKQAESLRPSGDAARAICLTLRRLGRWEDALNYAEKARSLIPRSYSIYSDELGYTRMVLRRFDEAEQDLNQAIAVVPQLNDAYLLKAQVLVERSGDVSTAKQVLLEMSRRTYVPEAAEATITQGFGGQLTSVALRLFPEECSVIVDAFEAGPVERYREMQPVAVATAHLARAIIFETLGDRPLAIARYDSARIYYERIIRSNPQSAYICIYHSSLGLAYAGLGRCEEAIREAEEGVRLVPVSKDAIVGPDQVFHLGEIYAKCGKYEAAIDQIEKSMSVPYAVSPGLLCADPLWDPLRSNPRFHRLMEGKQVTWK